MSDSTSLCDMASFGGLSPPGDRAESWLFTDEDAAFFDESFLGGFHATVSPSGVHNSVVESRRVPIDE